MILFLIMVWLTNMDIKKLREQLDIHEGIRSKVYTDTTGHRTIGIGFNLERSDAPQIIKSIGADYSKVLSGKQTLTAKQIHKLLDYDINQLESQARNLVSNYDSLNDVRQRVVLDMIFNLGVHGFRKFKATRGAIESKQYGLAARRMRNSLWYRQVKSRGRHLCKMMETGQDVYNF